MRNSNCNQKFWVLKSLIHLHNFEFYIFKQSGFFLIFSKFLLQSHRTHLSCLAHKDHWFDFSTSKHWESWAELAAAPSPSFLTQHFCTFGTAHRSAWLWRRSQWASYFGFALPSWEWRLPTGGTLAYDATLAVPAGCSPLKSTRIWLKHDNFFI